MLGCYQNLEDFKLTDFHFKLVSQCKLIESDNFNKPLIDREFFPDAIWSKIQMN